MSTEPNAKLVLKMSSTMADVSPLQRRARLELAGVELPGVVSVSTTTMPDGRPALRFDVVVAADDVTIIS